MIKTLYDDSEVVKEWLSHAPRSWTDYLKEEQRDLCRKLKEETDMLKIGRLQGKLEVIDRLVGLKEELNDVVVKKRGA